MGIRVKWGQVVASERAMKQHFSSGKSKDTEGDLRLTQVKMLFSAHSANYKDRVNSEVRIFVWSSLQLILPDCSLKSNN